MFDESASWYLPLPPTPDDSILISDEEVSEAEMPPNEDIIEALEEIPISLYYYTFELLPLKNGSVSEC